MHLHKLSDCAPICLRPCGRSYVTWSTSFCIYACTFNAYYACMPVRTRFKLFFTEMSVLWTRQLRIPVFFIWNAQFHIQYRVKYCTLSFIHWPLYCVLKCAWRIWLSSLSIYIHIIISLKPNDRPIWFKSDLNRKCYRPLC